MGKNFGVIAWAVVLTYLFCNKIFWWLWGSVVFIGFAAGIYIAIRKNREKKNRYRY